MILIYPDSPRLRSVARAIAKRLPDTRVFPPLPDRFAEAVARASVEIMNRGAAGLIAVAELASPGEPPVGLLHALDLLDELILPGNHVRAAVPSMGVSLTWVPDENPGSRDGDGALVTSASFAAVLAAGSALLGADAVVAASSGVEPTDEDIESALTRICTSFAANLVNAARRTDGRDIVSQAVDQATTVAASLRTTTTQTHQLQRAARSAAIRSGSIPSALETVPAPGRGKRENSMLLERLLRDLAGWHAPR